MFRCLSSGWIEIPEYTYFCIKNQAYMQTEDNTPIPFQNFISMALNISQVFQNAKKMITFQ